MIIRAKIDLKTTWRVALSYKKIVKSYNDDIYQPVLRLIGYTRDCL